MPLQPILGAVARNEQFYVRPPLVNNFIEKIQQQHVHLIAPRRYGKTSLMAYAENYFNTDNKSPKNTYSSFAHFFSRKKEFAFRLKNQLVNNLTVFATEVS